MKQHGNPTADVAPRPERTRIKMPRCRLAKIRVEAGFVNAAAGAAAVGISKVHLHNIEQGRAGCSLKVREKMAELYNVPLDVIEQAMSEERAELLRRELDFHVGGTNR